MLIRDRVTASALTGLARVTNHFGKDPEVKEATRVPRPEELTAAHWGNGNIRPLDPIGWFAHQQGVEKLQKSFYAIPENQRVRLAKKTSNLFRSRTKTTVPGLDVSGLSRVIAVDPEELTADVQGMCTFEDLVDTLLPFGCAPYVVPELKTITLGGAVTGMGVESSSFRNGLPHESVLEMDILTGTGEVVTCSPEQNADLYRAFPNSYGSLGYAVRLKIKIEKVAPFVQLRHVRFDDFASISAALAEISRSREFEGEAVDYLDGVVFSPSEAYLVLGRKSWDIPAHVSDYTGERIYYRSIQHPSGVTRDCLTTHDYLWRWDTDWFWCSRAFGAQDPKIRRFWPKGLLRSSFYWKLIGLDKKYDIADRLNERKGQAPRERVVQDIEVTTQHLPEFLNWFFSSCDIQPVWLCPILLAKSSEELTSKGDVLLSPEAAAGGADVHPWPLYPLSNGDLWINVGFWSDVPADLLGVGAPKGAFNREIEKKVDELGGHKSLYSEAFYSEEQFAALYGGEIPALVKKVYDPKGRFPSLFDKAVGGK
ncbi:MAG: FAD-binding oxidoreductase [Corynebacterium sp.]|nr:FAD-binding oxidoreductase [Corynebacterium sp.]